MTSSGSVQARAIVIRQSDVHSTPSGADVESASVCLRLAVGRSVQDSDATE